jgi:transcriptional regulator PpsR
MLVSVACDIAMVLDDTGVIRSVATRSGESVSSTAAQWVGLHWTDTVTGDTRKKAQEFLDDLASTGISRLRHLTHEEAGNNLPIAYTAVRLGDQGPTLAVGRDMRIVSAMQQRLMQTQEDIERDYWHRRQVETRYRLLFQLTAEPTLIIDAHSLSVIDANKTAAPLFGKSVEQLIGSRIVDAIHPDAIVEFHNMLENARHSARTIEGQTRLAIAFRPMIISLASFQTDASAVYLLRAHGTPDVPVANTNGDGALAELVKRMPDPIVICDLKGSVIFANAGFRTLVQFSADQPIDGHDLSGWIGRRDGELLDILRTVENTGFVRLLGTYLTRNRDSRIGIELSGTLIPALQYVGFVLRVSHHHDAVVAKPDDGLPRDVH